MSLVTLVTSGCALAESNATLTLNILPWDVHPNDKVRNY